MSELHELGRDLDEKLGLEIEKNEKLRARIKVLETRDHERDRWMADEIAVYNARIKELEEENAELRLALAGAKRVISIAATIAGKEAKPDEDHR